MVPVSYINLASACALPNENTRYWIKGHRGCINGLPIQSRLCPPAHRTQHIAEQAPPQHQCVTDYAIPSVTTETCIHLLGVYRKARGNVLVKEQEQTRLAQTEDKSTNHFVYHRIGQQRKVMRLRVRCSLYVAMVISKQELDRWLAWLAGVGACVYIKLATLKAK